MDFVTKKVLEAKVKGIGKDLGISNGFGATSSAQQERSHPLNIGSDSYDEFPVQAASHFESMPSNFPPILNLFYVDTSILSAAAKSTVGWAYRVFLAVEALLVLNLVSMVVKTVMMKGKEWLHIVLSALVGVLVTLFELFGYDTAFRGAYRTNSRLRFRYICLSTVTLVLCGIYAFAGAAWFNGWTRVVQYNKARREKSEGSASPEMTSPGTVGVIFSAIESFGWTVALFLVTFTLFDFYHLWQNGNQGLSDEALRIARGIEPGNTHTTTSENDVVQQRNDQRRVRPNAERVEQIRNKYASRS